MKTKERIYRSRTEKKIAGVCGGLAEYLDVDSTLVRLSIVFLALITAVFPVVLTYIVAWLIIPPEPVRVQFEG